MRMGVALNGAAMRGPTRMTDAACAMQRGEFQFFFEITQLAFRTPTIKRACMNSCNAS